MKSFLFKGKLFLKTTKTKKMSKDLKNVVDDMNQLNGIWKLTYTLVNDLGPSGFGGKLISSYSDPITQQGRHLFGPNGEFMTGFFMTKTQGIFDTTENVWFKVLIDWLIGHPDVGINKNQIKLSDKFLKNKISNPRFHLVNLDYQDISELEEEDEIDKMVGLISQDSGINSLSLEKLRIILSSLILVYRDAKYIKNPKIEKQKLRKTLKSFARKGIEETRKISGVIEKLDDAKYTYEIKKHLRTNIMSVEGGTYVYKGNPLATSTNTLIIHFKNFPDFYGEVQKELYDKLKSELTD